MDLSIPHKKEKFSPFLLNMKDSTADAEQVGNGLLGIIFHIIIPSRLDRQHFFIILFCAAVFQQKHKNVSV